MTTKGITMPTKEAKETTAEETSSEELTDKEARQAERQARRDAQAPRASTLSDEYLRSQENAE